jgi:hypothetical protein
MWTAVQAQRAAWAKAHPKAQAGLGPFPWKTTVMLRRDGVAVPQTVKVRFADGSTEKFTWDGEQPWQRVSWIRPSQAVSVEIDPEGRNRLDTAARQQLAPGGRWPRRPPLGP